MQAKYFNLFTSKLKILETVYFYTLTESGNQYAKNNFVMFSPIERTTRSVILSCGCTVYKNLKIEISQTFNKCSLRRC